MIETEALIIGKGPAGIQAAVYLKRSNVPVTVIGKDIGMCVKARTVENYYGIPAISGPELVENGIAQAQALGVDVVSDEVISVSTDGTGYTVKTVHETYKATTLLFASGAARNVPRIKNLVQFEGKGVSYCAVCDAFFYRGSSVAVIGHGDYAASEAAELLSVAQKVTVFTDGHTPEGDFDERIEIITDKVSEIVGEQTVSAVIAGGKAYDVKGVFVAIGTASSTDLAQKLGVYVENNRIVVNETKETNLPGLYAAGDCTPGIQQIAKAVGDGCVAGMNMVMYVRKSKKRGN